MPRQAPVPSAPEPGTLPAGTTLRFLILVVAMAVATLKMLSGVLRPYPARDVRFLCEFAAGYDPNSNLFDNVVRSNAQAEAIKECAKGAPVTPEWYGLGGSAVVLLAAVAVYFLLPRWKRLRRGLVPLQGRDPHGEIRAELTRVAGAAGVHPLPDLVVDLTALDAGAVVFGRAGRRTLCLNNGLLNARRSDPARFRAVVLHELTHLRHRDVDIAYAVTALWWAFLVLATVPFTLAVGGSLVAAQFGWFMGADAVFWPAARPYMVREVTAAAFLFLLVVLARADTLRHRELYADRGAVALGADPGVWRTRAEGPLALDRPARSITALWRSHPSWEERCRVLRDPAGLFALTKMPLFLLGAVTLVTGNALSHLWGDQAAAWLVGGLAAALLTVSVWRAALYAAHRGFPGASYMRAGSALGIGLICGELLSGAGIGPNWWPTHAESLLFPFLGAVVYVCWLAQCSRLHLRATPGTPPPLRGAMLVAGAAGCVVAVAGLGWWMGEGQFWLTGNLYKAGGLEQHIREAFPGPWDQHEHYATVLPWIATALVSASVAGSTPLIAAAAVVLWVYPAVLLLRRPLATGLRSTVLTGLAGGLLGVLAVAAVMTYVHSWRPPLEERGSAFGAVYMWWRTVALWAGVVATAAVVAVTTRTHRLPRALAAAGIAHIVALAGQFVLQPTDGCLGPLRVMGNTCHWLPDASWPLTELLVQTAAPAMFGAALFAALLVRLPRSAIPAAPAETVRRVWPTRITVGTVVGVALVSSVVAVRSVTDGGAALAMPERPPATDTAEGVRSFQLLAWFKTSGQADVVALSAHYVALEKWLKQSTDAENDTFDGDALRPICTGLARDTATARDHLGIPDPELGRKWSALLAKSRDAARECTSVLDSQTDDVQRNTKMLEQLFDAYAQAGDALPDLTDRVGTALNQWPQWKAS
ncbi:M48 family metalloprotease [Streptomyces sp. SP18CS02]|uniref:M48 family metalloprotease n=1 Tax=Streptomyces sp. SP18CS02 TaxID=3002531 RepID=UPI002E78A376|nr:M48 family metalloprotease [Streptomyces sp. SP18CS02]MEE1751195.1 M48 family metalloprotease [Streptomyces sp. SP18CS02]